MKLVAAIILLSFLLSAALYSHLPSQVAIHWNAKGEANGYAPKAFGLFLLPCMTLLMLLLFIIIPKLDPLKQNVAKFKMHYDRFILLVIGFFLYLHTLTLAWNLGIKLNMITFLMPALSVLFFFCGVLMEHAKRNWFIGIRTPWTMSSEKVWDKTHKLGAKLFKMVGLVGLAGMLVPDYAIYIMIIPLLAVSLWLIAYSYIEYRKTRK